MTIRTPLETDLCLKHAMSDISLFTKHIRKNISGMTGLYSDDFISCGDESFFKETKKTMDRFNSPIRKIDNITFAGVRVIQSENLFFLSQ